VIVGMTRGHVDLDLDGRLVTIQGEAYRSNPPLVVAYSNTLTTWHDGTPLTEPERDTILAALRTALSESGMNLEVE
jgi:hypothetical protein